MRMIFLFSLSFSLSLSLINVVLVHTRLFEESAIGNLKMFLLMPF